MTNRWAVIGGGMLGLSLSRRLVAQGRDVTLIESAPFLGGLASAWQLGDVVWDRHYHVTLLSDSYTRGELAALGLDDEVRWVETKTGYYADGALSSVSNSVEFLRLPSLSLVDKARLATTILYGSRVKNWRSLEQQSVESWLRRWSGSQTFDRFWLPLLRAKLGESYRESSAAFIWATIQRLYAARKSGLKKEMFGYVPGGYARILDTYAKFLIDAGVSLEVGRPVTSITRRGSGVEVAYAGGSETFDHVVVTANPTVAARLIPELDPGARTRLESVRYQGIVCTSLLLTDPLSPYYLTYITDESPVTAVVEMTAFVDRAEFGGRSLVYLPKYVDRNDPRFEASDDDVVGTAVTTLQEMYPTFRPEHVAAARVSRVREVFPIPVLGYSTTVPPVETTIPGLHLVNSAQIVNGTLNVNDTVRLADSAAQKFSALP